MFLEIVLPTRRTLLFYMRNQVPMTRFVFTRDIPFPALNFSFSGFRLYVEVHSWKNPMMARGVKVSGNRQYTLNIANMRVFCILWDYSWYFKIVNSQCASEMYFNVLWSIQLSIERIGSFLKKRIEKQPRIVPIRIFYSGSRFFIVDRPTPTIKHYLA